MIKKLWKWYYNKFVADDSQDNIVKLDKLKWLPKTLTSDKNVPFGYIDSIQFDIENIPIKEELILDIITREQIEEVIKNV